MDNEGSSSFKQNAKIKKLFKNSLAASSATSSSNFTPLSPIVVGERIHSSQIAVAREWAEEEEEEAEKSFRLKIVSFAIIAWKIAH